jgi:hypothetical protein
MSDVVGCKSTQRMLLSPPFDYRPLWMDLMSIIASYGYSLYLISCQGRKKLTDPPGFEPGSEAPEASILSRLYYESITVIMIAGCKGSLIDREAWQLTRLNYRIYRRRAVPPEGLAPIPRLEI